MNEKELKESLKEQGISEQQFRVNILNTLNKLNTLQLFKVLTKALRDNPKITAELQIKTGVGIKVINGIPSIDWEYYESIDSGITERVKKQMEKKVKKNE